MEPRVSPATTVYWLEAWRGVGRLCELFGVGVTREAFGSRGGIITERGARVGVGPGIRVGEGRAVEFMSVAWAVPPIGTKGS